MLRELSLESSLKWLILRLKLQYFGHLMWTGASMEKSLILGKIEGRWGSQSMRRLNGITYTMNMNLGKPWELVWDREVWSSAVCGVTKSWTQLGDWTNNSAINSGRNRDYAGVSQGGCGWMTANAIHFWCYFPWFHPPFLFPTQLLPSLRN